MPVSFLLGLCALTVSLSRVLQIARKISGYSVKALEKAAGDGESPRPSRSHDSTNFRLVSRSRKAGQGRAIDDTQPSPPCRREFHHLAVFCQ